MRERRAMSVAAPASSELTARFVNPVLSATRSVFETMLGCVPQRTQIAVKERMVPPYELSAVIGVSGRAAGMLVLSLPRGTAAKVLERLMGDEPLVVAEGIGTDVCDAVGELTNMIAGAAKSQLPELALSISLPTVISGEDHRVHYPSDVRPLCIVFESEIGPFAVEAGFSPRG